LAVFRGQQLLHEEDELQGKNGIILSGMGECSMLAWQEHEQLPELEARRKQQVRITIACLSKRQRRVVRMHYGLLGKEMSHEEIGLKLGISTAEVDSIYGQAMGELQRFADDFGGWVERERKKESQMARFLRTIQ